MELYVYNIPTKIANIFIAHVYVGVCVCVYILLYLVLDVCIIYIIS